MNGSNTSGRLQSAFPATPDATRYFPLAGSEACRQRVTRAVARDEGPTLVIGSPGCGKTMLLEAVRHQFGDSCDAVTLLGSQLGTRKGLLQMVLFYLGMPYQGMDEGEMRLAIVDRLQREKPSARKLLLLIDEAEVVCGEVLEELRALGSIVRGGKPMVALVLAGGCALEERMGEPSMQALNQRVAARSYLQPMGYGESAQYVRAHVEAVGVEPGEVFTDDACRSIWQVTDGVPRLVNQLCDQLMWSVSETGAAPLDAAAVEMAWCELQQIPTSALAMGGASLCPESGKSSGGVVEFGELGADDPAVSEVDGSFDDDEPASIPFQSVSYEEVCLVDVEDPEGLGDPGPAAEIDPQQRAPEPIEDVVLEQAVDPFAEEFSHEEVIVDRYPDADAGCSPFDLRGPVQVTTLPSEAPEMGQACPTPSGVRPSSDVLVVEELDCEPIATVVPGRSLRRLFTSLETGEPLTKSG